ncbi:Toxoplasma gondii family E protein, partial [Toxoplasma gondii GT1]
MVWSTGHDDSRASDFPVRSEGSSDDVHIEDILGGNSSPSNREEEAAVIRALAEKALAAAALMSSVLPRLHHGSNAVRAVSQQMVQHWTFLLEQAQMIENGETNGDDSAGTSLHQGQHSSSDVAVPGDGVAALGVNRSASEPGATGGLLRLSYPKQVPFSHPRKPANPSLPTPRSRWAPLQTISETSVLDGIWFDSSSRSEIQTSIFGNRQLGKEDDQESSLKEALELADLDRRDLGGWHPFSSRVTDPRSLFTAASTGGVSGSSSGTGEAGGRPPSHLPELYSTVASRPARSTSAPPSRTQSSTTSAVKPVRSGPSPAPAGKRPLSVSRGLSPRGHAASRRTVSVGRASMTQSRRGDRSVSKDRIQGTLPARTHGATVRPRTTMAGGPRQTTQHGMDKKGAASGSEKGSGSQSSAPKDGGKTGTSGQQRGS